MYKNLTIAYLWMVLVSVSCKTTNEIEIKSNPDKSKVYLIDNSGAKDLIGETPTSISADDRLFRSSSLARISVESEGYESESFILNKHNLPTRDSLVLSLKDKTIGDDGAQKCESISSEKMNELASGVAIVQARMAKKEYDVALIKLSSLSAKFPYISVVWDLLGNVYYIEKKYESALEAYEKSLAIDSSNASTANIVNRLKELLGKRD
jgi:tetratricopeptide (TPR) repeat protein